MRVTVFVRLGRGAAAEGAGVALATRLSAARISIARNCARFGRDVERLPFRDCGEERRRLDDVGSGIAIV